MTNTMQNNSTNIHWLKVEENYFYIKWSADTDAGRASVVFEEVGRGFGGWRANLISVENGIRRTFTFRCESMIEGLERAEALLAKD